MPNVKMDAAGNTEAPNEEKAYSNCFEDRTLLDYLLVGNTGKFILVFPYIWYLLFQKYVVVFSRLQVLLIVGNLVVAFQSSLV